MPLAAVVCTEAISESFHNGLEYFNTFGGNPGDPDSFTRFRPYLAHFFPVFPRFLRVFTVSPRRFQRATSRNPGPRDSGKGAQTPFLRPS